MQMLFSALRQCGLMIKKLQKAFSFMKRSQKRKKNFLFVLIIIVIGANQILFAQNTEQQDIKKLFKGHKGSFVLYDKQNKKYFRYNEARCIERFLPASTFKIANSLIALETGVAADENFVIKWDGKKRWNADWNHDHNLASAIKYSVVPYYQELARRIGNEQYKKWLDAISYGNQVIGENIDSFWLDNSLKISADEQIIFMKRFYDYRLPFSKGNVDIVKKILPEEKYKHSILKYKTGTGTKEDGVFLGWLVGYVEKEENVYFYAFNIESKTFDEIRKLRDTTLRRILKSLKVLQ